MCKRMVVCCKVHRHDSRSLFPATTHCESFLLIMTTAARKPRMSPIGDTRPDSVLVVIPFKHPGNARHSYNRGASDSQSLHTRRPISSPFQESGETTGRQVQG